MDHKRVCIVTGAGRGIGREVAVQVASRGYRVVAVSRTETELRETARLAGGAAVMLADVADAGQVRGMVERVLQQFGRVDALVHCAGVAPMMALEQMDEQVWHDVVETNLSAAFYLAKAVWGAMKQQGGGVIVNVSSAAARDPFDGFSAYGAAKAGLNVFSRAMAREGGAHGIRVHAVAPGAVETAMFRGLFTEEQFPREKCLQPAEVAQIIVQCVTGELKHTTGEVIWIQKTLG